VALGEVTVEKNRDLPDANNRERLILATVAVVIIFMGIASPLFTRRMEASVNNVMLQVSPPQNAQRRVAPPSARPVNNAVSINAIAPRPLIAAIPERRVQR